jgi:aryl-alcohol dehydrogenase-like predicted oxidoreductase
MSSENIVVIPGAKSPEQVEENAGAAGWRLEFEDWMKLDEISRKVKITRVIW